MWKKKKNITIQPQIHQSSKGKSDETRVNLRNANRELLPWINLLDYRVCPSCSRALKMEINTVIFSSRICPPTLKMRLDSLAGGKSQIFTMLCGVTDTWRWKMMRWETETNGQINMQVRVSLEARGNLIWGSELLSDVWNQQTGCLHNSLGTLKHFLGGASSCFNLFTSPTLSPCVLK